MSREQNCKLWYRSINIYVYRVARGREREREEWYYKRRSRSYPRKCMINRWTINTSRLSCDGVGAPVGAQLQCIRSRYFGSTEGNRRSQTERRQNKERDWIEHLIRFVSQSFRPPNCPHIFSVGESRANKGRGAIVLFCVKYTCSEVQSRACPK